MSERDRVGRRVRRGALALGAILVVTAFFPRPAVVETLGGAASADVELALSPAFVLTSPAGAFFDHLTFVTDRQHVAILVGWLVVFLAWRGWRIAGGLHRERGIGRSALREGAVAAGSLAVLLAVYAIGVLSPRPMAALRTLDPDLVIVDFHAHTEASHDGRGGLDVEDRRGWNAGSGFDLVYLTDHLRASATVDPGLVALDGATRNPARAGEGVSILPGREQVWKRQHVIVLGLQDPVKGVPAEESWPVLIQTIPNDLSRVPVPEGRERVHAIELMDGDPRGIRQSMEDRELILALADSLDLVMISASNHHGWGTASPAWTLVRLPGWRDQAPQEVGRRLEELVRNGGVAANGLDAPGEALVRVVERPRLPGGTGDEGAIMAATTFPRFWWWVLTGLTPLERVVWLVWGVGGLALSGYLAGRKGPATASPANTAATPTTRLPSA